PAEAAAALTVVLATPARATMPQPLPPADNPFANLGMDDTSLTGPATSITPRPARRRLLVVGALGLVGLVLLVVLIWMVALRNGEDPGKEGPAAPPGPPRTGPVKQPPKTPVSETPEQAVAALQKLGAKIVVDEGGPGKPVTELVLLGAPATDADLVHLQGLT